MFAHPARPPSTGLVCSHLKCAIGQRNAVNLKVTHVDA